MTQTHTITATVEFSFRGELNQLEATLDVAHLTDLLSSGDEGAVHRVIATHNALDTYSYAYEVMEMQPIRFSGATGLIARFIEDGQLNVPAYLQAWQAADHTVLAQIALQYLQIDTLSEHPALLNALQAAYQAGKTTHA